MLTSKNVELSRSLVLQRFGLVIGMIVVWFIVIHNFTVLRLIEPFVIPSYEQNYWFEVGTYLITIILAVADGIAQLLIDQKQQRQLAIQESIRLKDAIKQAELASLKKQISPHFFYNTLNFFYAQSVQYSENLSRGILLLSEIMRYAIKDDDEEGKVHLSKEVTQIKNYVELNQLRFDNKLCIRFEIIGNLEYRRIVPLILLTFVENAFKFGDLSNPHHPLLIEISVKENHLIFKTYNKKCADAKKQSGGIGLSNTRRRLELAYPNRHELTTKDEGDFFSLTLHLVL